ncbi:MAG: HD domain-containing protein [Defluviitaleaceae bacterium]|nr:HD domain-containing protein [Defluviitaleaceae bacterium]
MRYISDLKENEHIVDHYLCKQKQSQKTRAGKTYYALKLQDRTGAIDAKVWELTSDIQNFEEGDVVKIDANVQSYNNELQIKINKLRKSTEGEYSDTDYIPVTEKDIEAMFAQLTGMIKSIENKFVKTLLENIILKDETRMQLLKTHSAAKHMHHSCKGGLLEHTVSIAEICDFMCGRYRHINRDILMAGALLHDIGKLYELSPLPQNDYTDDGQMLGHIIIGLELVAIEIQKIPGFPHQLGSLIKHLIISHHGEYEYGSPKLPSTPEAMLLHYADNMDAKLKTFEEVLDKDNTPGPWAGYQKALARYIRKSEFE